MTWADTFGHAIRDYLHGEMAEPLIQRDGTRVREYPLGKTDCSADQCDEVRAELTQRETTDAYEHPIEGNYFEEFDPTANQWEEWSASWLDGPLLDIGAGTGRDTLYFQEQFETVAIEISESLLEIMRERGVHDARRTDMFALRETFDRDRFRSVLVFGIQMGLTKPMQGLRQFLGDLAYVTTSDATAVLDCFDPDHEEAADLFGYRPDPTRGLAYRVMHFEYEGNVDGTMLFRLFSPERVQEAVVGTGWEVAEINRSPGYSPHYQVALSKS